MDVDFCFVAILKILRSYFVYSFELHDKQNAWVLYIRSGILSHVFASHVLLSLSTRCKSFPVGGTYGWTSGFNCVRGDASVILFPISVVGPVSWLEAGLLGCSCSRKGVASCIG